MGDGGAVLLRNLVQRPGWGELLKVATSYGGHLADIGFIAGRWGRPLLGEYLLGDAPAANGERLPVVITSQLPSERIPERRTLVSNIKGRIWFLSWCGRHQ